MRRSGRRMQRSQQAEEGLKESQERLRLAMTTAQMGYHYRKLETGGRTGDRLGALCGLPPGSSFANDKQFLNAVHPDNRERVAEAVTANAETHGLCTPVLRSYPAEWSGALACRPRQGLSE